MECRIDSNYHQGRRRTCPGLAVYILSSISLTLTRPSPPDLKGARLVEDEIRDSLASF